MYWVSCIIQARRGADPWTCSASDGCLTEAEAMRLAANYKRKFRCLCVWIEKHEDGKAVPVWHECLLDSIGGVPYWDRPAENKSGKAATA